MACNTCISANLKYSKEFNIDISEIQDGLMLNEKGVVVPCSCFKKVQRNAFLKRVFKKSKITKDDVLRGKSKDIKEWYKGNKSLEDVNKLWLLNKVPKTHLLQGSHTFLIYGLTETQKTTLAKALFCRLSIFLNKDGEYIKYSDLIDSFTDFNNKEGSVRERELLQKPILFIDNALQKGYSDIGNSSFKEGKLNSFIDKRLSIGGSITFFITKNTIQQLKTYEISSLLLRSAKQTGLIVEMKDVIKITSENNALMDALNELRKQ